MNKMIEKNWESYISNMEKVWRSPRPLLVKAISFVGNKDKALDLGPGLLGDSVYLLENGFGSVVAVDKEKMAEGVFGFIDQNIKERLDYKIISFEDYDFPENEFDLVNAEFSLPFINPENFSEVFKKIIRSLKIGGVFVFQLFGSRDDWAQYPRMTVHTKEKAQELVNGMEELYFKEEEKDGKTVSGADKHWYIFNFIVRKI